jgi:hypothetical protein
MDDAVGQHEQLGKADVTVKSPWFALGYEEFHAKIGIAKTELGYHLPSCVGT